MKVENYNTKLTKWVKEMLGKQLEPGKIDCVSLCVEGLKVIYGKNLFPQLENWTTEIEGRRVYINVGNPHSYLLNNKWKIVDKNYTQCGDIIIIDSEPMKTFSLIISPGKILLIHPETGVYISNINSITESFCCYRKIGE